MDTELLHSSSRLWDLDVLFVLSPGDTPPMLSLVESPTVAVGSRSWFLLNLWLLPVNLLHVVLLLVASAPFPPVNFSIQRSMIMNIVGSRRIHLATREITDDMHIHRCARAAQELIKAAFKTEIQDFFYS